MKQIPFYQNLKKKVIVSGPAIISGQWYQCVVYSSLTDSTHTISTTAQATEKPKPSEVPESAPAIGTVTFEFTRSQTQTLQLGDNTLAVYDIAVDSDDTEYTMYKVYDAKVIAMDSVVNHEVAPTYVMTYENVDSTTGYLKDCKFVNGFIILGDETVTSGYLKLT